MQRVAIARPLAGSAVCVTIGEDEGLRGPWSFVTDAWRPETGAVGPPPVYLALAAWAA